MARVSRRTSKRLPAKNAGRSRRLTKAKPARKAPARQVRKAKPAKSAPRSKAAARRAPKPKRPARASHADDVRRLVARHRPGEEHKPEAAAQHDHEDPRLAGVPGIAAEGDKVQAQNYGQFKNKAVARLDKPQNWFRRAAKPKQ